MKNCRKKIKSFVSDKDLASGNIALKEKSDLITDTQKLSNLFNTYFINITDIEQFALKILISLCNYFFL